ncbi:hypothetical protein CRV24_007034 [Beauveria bassiana]|nr:hypothetical protein CRV24_007034 [Beauveria bassiana]KAH8712799.1 hypothetical protein HC256_005973 [Beauveria bassiana]
MQIVNNVANMIFCRLIILDLEVSHGDFSLTPSSGPAICSRPQGKERMFYVDDPISRNLTAVQ